MAPVALGMGFVLGNQPPVLRGECELAGDDGANQINRVWPIG